MKFLQHSLRAAVLATLGAGMWVVGPSVQAASLTIVNDSCASFTAASDASGNMTVSCVTTPPTSGAPSCTIGASSTSLPIGGGNVTLNATCTGTTVPDKYVWSGPNVSAETTTPSLDVANITSTGTYYLTPSTAGVNGTRTSVTVTVATVTPPPTGTISCAGFTNTKVIEATVPANGAVNNMYYTSKAIFGTGIAAGFGAKDAIVIRFKAPSADPYFRITMNPSSGATASSHTAVLSTSACDFGIPSANNLFATATRSTFSITAASDSATATTNNLVGGQTYYLNVSNQVGGNWMCSASTCDVFFTFENFAP